MVSGGGGFCYQQGFVCPVLHESGMVHFMVSVLEKIMTGWRKRERKGLRMSSRVRILRIPDDAHPCHY